jgi:hypothetical protein
MKPTHRQFCLKTGHLGAFWLAEGRFSAIFEGYLTGNRIKSAQNATFPQCGALVFDRYVQIK